MIRPVTLASIGLAALVVGACAPAPSSAPTQAPAPTPAAAATLAAAATPAAAAASASGTPAAAARTLVNGKITAVESGGLTLDDGKSYAIADATPIRRQVAMTATDLKPGQYVGVTAKRQPDNTLLASIVTIIPTTGDTFQRPMEGGNLMTNATIDTVEGNSFTLSFQGGGAKVTLLPDAKIWSIQPGTRADLKVGAPATVVVSGGTVASVVVQPQS